MRLAAVALGVVALLVLAVARAAPAAADGGYRPPVAAPVADPFRPPAEPWGAGNRGLEYATAPGDEVRAAADGDVVFAGQVGGALHVVVLHGDGIRTSYSFLSSTRVQRGDRVRQGQVVGTTGAQPLHFGARAGDAYLDPAQLFGGGPPQAHLVPESERHPATEAHERAGLLGMLGGIAERAVSVTSGAAGASADAVGWAAGGAADAGRWAAGQATFAANAGLSALGRQVSSGLDDLRALAERCLESAPPVTAYRAVRAVASLLDQGACTPADVRPPPVRGHIAVLVGGLGSSGGATGGGAAIFGVGTAALGYRPADVVRFSYRGGTAAEHPYDKRDTEVDIRTSGARLRALLQRLQYEHPGAPVDILAHSQGGLVARAALAGGYDRSDSRMPQLGAIVTMGSPHHGTDGATAVAMLRRSPAADRVLAGVHGVLPNQDDPRAASITQMAESSTFVQQLNDSPLPDGVHFTSIAAREDWVVPAPHTRLAGADNIVVHVPSATAHDALPASAAAQRETGLALNGLAPTCHSLLTRVSDTLVSEGIRHVERTATGALADGPGAMP